MSSSFNPRPARRPGATGVGLCRFAGSREFQSSPGPKAGRYEIVALPRPARLPEFQSSPGPKAGRYTPELLREMGALRVSILARPEGRALPAETELLREIVNRFQSSPGPKAGRYSAATIRQPRSVRSFQSSPGPKAGRYACDDPRTAPCVGVSILARPEGRALRDQDEVLRPRDRVSILARPEGRALPPAAARRARAGRARFNPRPARRPGATRCAAARSAS